METVTTLRSEYKASKVFEPDVIGIWIKQNPEATSEELRAFMVSATSREILEEIPKNDLWQYTLQSQFVTIDESEDIEVRVQVIRKDPEEVDRERLDYWLENVI